MCCFFFFFSEISENVDLHGNLRIKVRAMNLPTNKPQRIGEIVIPMKTISPLGSVQQWYFIGPKTVSKKKKKTKTKTNNTIHSKISVDCTYFLKNRSSTINT